MRIGATTARGGMKRVDRMKKSQSFSPGILNLLKPYAQLVPKATLARVLQSPMTTLFAM